MQREAPSRTLGARIRAAMPAPAAPGLGLAGSPCARLRRAGGAQGGRLAANVITILRKYFAVTPTEYPGNTPG